MAISSATAVQLLAELLDLDLQARRRTGSLSLMQKQRRQVLGDQLRAWALERQRAPTGAEKRQHPRAEVKLRVQLIGGPRPVDVESRSLAEGGVAVVLRNAPRIGDRIAVRLVPPPPDEPLEATTQVVWYDPQSGRAGLHFSDLAADARAMLERLVYTHLVERG